MSMPISNGSNVEVVTSVQRRRRWTWDEKTGWVRRAMEPDMSVSLVASEAGVAPSQVFQWKGVLSCVHCGTRSRVRRERLTVFLEILKCSVIFFKETYSRKCQSRIMLNIAMSITPYLPLFAKRASVLHGSVLMQITRLNEPVLVAKQQLHPLQSEAIQMRSKTLA